MTAFTPELEHQTLFGLNENGRIISTREPNPSPGPRFTLIRDTTGCAWATRADVSDEVAARLGNLAREEPPPWDVQDEPVCAQQYLSLVGGRVDFGLAYTFPDAIVAPVGVVAVGHLAQLEQNFRG